MTLAHKALDTFLLRRKSAFRYPMDPAPRTAVLAACFRQPRIAAELSRASLSEGLVGGSFRIRPGRHRGHSRTTVGPGGRQTSARIHPCGHRAGEARRSDAARWPSARGCGGRFAVPVFEQIIGPDGELLAAECEAHDGLHIEVAGLPWEGYRLELAACGCGRKTPRLTPAEPAERVRSAAAYAR